MLAPRKKLWSTPIEALERAVELLSPSDGDIVYDIGCGDGNFILTGASLCSDGVIWKGVEIESTRAQEAIDRLQSFDIVPPSATVITANALEHDYCDGSCLFMYLIPRGLRLILPKLQAIPHPIRVVTFMNPLPGIEPVSVSKISTAAHPDALWPLFYYEMDNSPSANVCTTTHDEE